MENTISKTITTEDCAPFIGRKIPVTKYKSTLKLKEIADRFGISKTQLRTEIEQWNVPVINDRTAGACVQSYIILAWESKRLTIQNQ